MENDIQKNYKYTAKSVADAGYQILFDEITQCGERPWNEKNKKKRVRIKGEKYPIFEHPKNAGYSILDFSHLYEFLETKIGYDLIEFQKVMGSDPNQRWGSYYRGQYRVLRAFKVQMGICTAAKFLKIELIRLLAEFLKDCEHKKIRLFSYGEYEEFIKSFLHHAPDSVEQPQAISPPPSSQDNQEHSSGQTVAKKWSGYKPVTGEEKWLDPNNHQQLPLRGRRDEFNRLNEFIEADGQFKIWAVAGPSGAGKTRLVSEWSTTSPKLTGWHCRVLHKEDRAESDPDKRSRWSSARPILIIIDYMYGFEEVIQKLMKNRLEATSPKIRLLVIDHVFSEDLHKDERWGLTGNQSSFNQNEEYFFKLKPLDLRQTQEEINKSIIAHRANIDEGSNQVANANKYLLKLKEQGAYHPLFAALLGDAIRSGKDFTVWNRRELIAYYLSGNDRLPWKHQTKAGRWASHFIAVATARRNITYKELSEAARKSKFAPKHFGKVKKICQKVITKDDEIILAPFEPDILGESFFLKFLQFLQDSEYQEEFRQAFIAGDAKTQAKDATEFIGFIQRLTRNLLNDDQNNKETRSLWNALFDFMTPSNFEDAQPIKWAVTAGLIDIVDAIKDQFPENELVVLLNNIEPNVFYRDNEEEASLSESVWYFMHYFELIHRDSEISPVLSEETIALFDRYTANNAETPLILASYYKFNNLINALIACNVNIEAVLPDGKNALMIASLRGHTQTVKCLLNGQPNIDANDKDGRTALLWASYKNHIDIVKLLLDREANIDASDNDGCTALSQASDDNRIEMVKLLLDKRAKTDTVDKDGRTALILASRKGHIETVRLLLDKRVDIHVADHIGRTALMWASFYGRSEMVELLLDNGANIHATDIDGLTALMYASGNGHIETIGLLLENEAEIDVDDLKGRTALLWASIKGRAETVKLLFDTGANIEAADKQGFTGLIYASFYGHTEIVRLLLEKGAKPNVADIEGRTPLMWASVLGHISVRLLLEKGAEVNIADIKNHTGLIPDNRSRHIKTVMLLLEKEANIHVIDKEGRTALMWACLIDRVEAVELLLNKEARVDVVDNNGQTALSIAKAKGHEEIVQLLVNHGAQN